MAVDFNNLLLNAMLNVLDTELPASSEIKFYTGAQPGAEAAATGTLLGTLITPATPWGAAASASKAKSGTWSFTAVASGTCGWARLKNAADTRRIDFTVTGTGGGGDITLDNAVLATSQVVTLTSLTITGAP